MAYRVMMAGSTGLGSRIRINNIPLILGLPGGWSWILGFRIRIRIAVTTHEKSWSLIARGGGEGGGSGAGHRAAKGTATRTRTKLLVSFETNVWGLPSKPYLLPMLLCIPGNNQWFEPVYGSLSWEWWDLPRPPSSRARLNVCLSIGFGSSLKGVSELVGLGPPDNKISFQN